MRSMRRGGEEEEEEEGGRGGEAEKREHRSKRGMRRWMRRRTWHLNTASYDTGEVRMRGME